MELLLAFAGLAIGLVLAHRGILHPYDYAVAAGLALLLGLCVIPFIPGDDWARQLEALGAPRRAVARDAFFAAHGMKIVAACAIFAVGASAEGWLRSRRAPRDLD